MARWYTQYILQEARTAVGIPDRTADKTPRPELANGEKDEPPSYQRALRCVDNMLSKLNHVFHLMFRYREVSMTTEELKRHAEIVWRSRIRAPPEWRWDEREPAP